MVILANSRWQSGPVLVVIMITSIHALLLHLLVASAFAWAGMAEDSDPLGSGRSPTGDAAAFYMCSMNLIIKVEYGVQHCQAETEEAECGM